jgi:hypothetical protein
MYIVDRRCTHPWLDRTPAQRIVGSPELNSWTPAKNLGEVVTSVVQHFGMTPPICEREQPAPQQQQQQQQQQGRGPAGPPAYPGGPSPFTPSSSSSGVAQQQYQQQPPPGVRPPAAAANSSGGGTPMSSSPYPAAYPPAGSYAGGGYASRPADAGAGPSASSSSTGGSHPAGPGGGPSPSQASPGMQSQASTPSRRPATALPPIPPSFPELSGLSLADLQELLESEEARAGFLAQLGPYRTFSSVATSARNGTLDAARLNVALAAELEAAKTAVERAEGEAARARDELGLALRRQAEVADRFSAPRLARELARVATELERGTDAMAESIAASEEGGGGGAGGMGGGGGERFDPRLSDGGSGRDDGMSVVSGSTYGGSGGALRGFRDDYLEQRKAMHAARIKADILKTVGLAE